MTTTAISTDTSCEANAEFDRRMALVTRSIDQYHTYLQHYLYGLTRQWQDAEDVLQELWQEVLMHFDEAMIGEVGILRRRARQLCANRFRAAVRRFEVINSEPGEHAIAPATGEPMSEAEEAALQVRFWEEYQGDRLTQGQRDCLWQVARHRLSHQEIADLYGLPKSTVTDWIARARQHIRSLLNR